MKLGMIGPPSMINQLNRDHYPKNVPSGKVVVSHDRARMVQNDKIIQEELNDDDVDG